MVNHSIESMWQQVELAGRTHVRPITLVTKETWQQGQHGFDEQVMRWLNVHDFSGKAGEYCVVPNQNGEVARVVLGVDTEDFWAIGALPAKLPAGEYCFDASVPTEQLVQCALVWGLSCYEYSAYKTKAPKKKWPMLLIPDTVPLKELDEVRAWVVTHSLVRDLINAPADDLNPETLAEQVALAVEPYGAQVSVIVGEDLLTRQFPAVHAVGRAATVAPRLIEVSWGNPSDPSLTLVGKGVCFDSGGLDLKPASGMRDMKKDMGGAAHALGLSLQLMQTKQPLSLRLLIPAVENAVAGNAYRPGDIVKTRHGLSIEIDNTDAEGRMILCDVLSYACQDSPDLLIDFATLTGAARVAMGPDIPAFFCKDQALSQAVWEAGQAASDPVWSLPLYTPYEKFLSSNVADYKNCASTGYGGAITAALFLKQFVAEAQAWLHFDLMAANTRALPGRPEGGEVQGLRAIYRMLKDRYRL